MSILDKLSANVTNMERVVSQKIKNTWDAGSLSSDRNSEKASIQRNLSEIGKLYYEKYKENPDPDFAELVEAVKVSEQRIAELDAQIENVRAREPELVPVPEDVKPVKPTSRYCLQCGATYPVSEKFCSVCGIELVDKFADGASPEAAPAEKKAPVEPVTVPLVNPAPKPPVVNGVVAVEDRTDLPDLSKFDAAPAEENIPEAPKENDVPEAPAVPESPAVPETPAENADPEAPAAPAADAPAEEAAVGFCAYCGKAAKPGQRFCPYCGKAM